MGDRASGKADTRCAIYTRKSSEEGLEQGAVSLKRTSLQMSGARDLQAAN